MRPRLYQQELFEEARKSNVSKSDFSVAQLEQSLITLYVKLLSRFSTGRGVSGYRSAPSGFQPH